MENFTVSIPDLSAEEMAKFVRIQESCYLTALALNTIRTVIQDTDLICKLPPAVMSPLFQLVCFWNEDFLCDFSFWRDRDGKQRWEIGDDDYYDKFSKSIFKNESSYDEKWDAFDRAMTQVLGEIWDMPAKEFE